MAGIRIITDSPRGTKELGKILGEELREFKHGSAGAFVIFLKGDLGAGKTVFAKGLALGLGIRGRVLSPTFAIAKRYPVKKSRFKNLWHIDCYRLKAAKETKPFNLSDILENKNNVVAIEWPEKIKLYIPKQAVVVEFGHKKKNTRIITATHGE